MNHLTAMPLAWLSTLFLAGIVLSGNFDFPAISWLVAGVLFLSGIFLEIWAARRFFNRARLMTWSPLPVAVLLLSLCCGAALYQLNLPSWNSSDLAWYNGRFDVEVSGYIADIPLEADKSVSLIIEAHSIRLRGGKPVIPVQGRMMVRSAAGGGYYYGDRLRIRGNLVQPPGNETFSYREYLARKGVYSWLATPEISRSEGRDGSPVMQFVFDLRVKLEDNIRRMLPPDEAALLIGVLLGYDKGLPADARDAFRETGTSHILAVSGFNISILVALVAAFFRRLIPRLWSLLPVAVVILLFSLMVGGQASVVRAAVMGCAVQLGLALGRRTSGINALIFSAALMSLFNPFILWDIGFQLSFAATLGILLWGDKMTEAALRLSERLLPPSIAARFADWTAEFLLITLAAQVFTLPISAYHFQTFSWVGLLANPLILPVQQLLMMLGGLAALTSLLFFPLGQLLAWLAWPFCAYTLVCARLLAAAGQGIWQTGEVPVLFIVLFYAALLALSFQWKQILPALKKSFWPASLLLGSVLVLLIWRAYFTSPDGRLHIIRLDYSAETVYYLITPGGNHILINGMSKPQQTASLIGGQIFPVQPRLDAVFLTGERDIYAKGLPVFLANNVVDQIVALPDGSAALPKTAGGDPAIRLQTGQAFAIGDGGFIAVQQTSRGCADLEITYGRMRAWFSQCNLPQAEPSHPMEWSVISLSQSSLSKEDAARLARLQSSLVISRGEDPGILSHPNWITAIPGAPLLIISDGEGMTIGQMRTK